MDPITILNAVLAIISALIVLWGKVWDAASPAARTASADATLGLLHNMAVFILSLQDKINAAVNPPPKV